MDYRTEEIMNQLRFMILTIASDCVKNSTSYNLLPMLKLLAKTPDKTFQELVKNLIKNRNNFLTKTSWMFYICWTLSLDKAEAMRLA